jgi:serine/threonine protein kinase
MKTCPKCRSPYGNGYAVCPRDGTALVAAPEWSEGAIIRAKFRIISVLSERFTGHVYKALHLKFDQLRALWVIGWEEAANQHFIKLLAREAGVLSKLQHPNVERVEDLDESEDGSPFVVMEFVEGRSLEQVIQQEGPLPPLRVCSIAKQVAAGLGAAHSLGLLHSDVQPEKIVLVGAPGAEIAKVVDFCGVNLKRAWGASDLESDGMILVRPQYASPEFIMAKDLDSRSDLYSLGVVMYQMLTRELPFQADSLMGWLLAHLQKPPRPIQSVRPDLAIPDALANFVMRCLEKNRDVRPADAQEFIREIERVEAEIRQPPFS